jgi:hypothetical protein
MRKFCKHAHGPQDCLEPHTHKLQSMSMCLWRRSLSSVADSHKEGAGALVSVEGETVTMRTSSSGEQTLTTAPNTQSVQIGPVFALNTTAVGNCLLPAISICLWKTPTLSLAHAQSFAESPTSEASLIRQGLKQFMMFNRDLLFLHCVTLFGGKYTLSTAVFAV